MKIYTLVRTELHNDANVWHFPTLSMAQGKMCDECSKIVGQHCSLNATIDNPNWTCEVGEYYATCSNGNSIEFEIIEKNIDFREFLIHSITNRVVERYPNTRMYYDIIYNQIDSLDSSYVDGYMPIMTAKGIDDYIDGALHGFMISRAADTLFDGENLTDCDLKDAHSSVLNYLADGTSFVTLARIINNDCETIDQMKMDIDNCYSADGITIFGKECVYVYKSSWDDGEKFERDETIKVFKNWSAAYKFMEEDQEAAVSKFAKYYAKTGVTLEKDKNKALVYVNDGCIVDLWKGTITKMYVQD